MATKKITLEGLAKLITDGFAASDKKFAGMDSKFAALADDIADMRREIATKEQLFALQTQVTSIETQLRGMNYGKLETRVANLEDEVFGSTRANHARAACERRSNQPPDPNPPPVRERTRRLSIEIAPCLIVLRMHHRARAISVLRL